VTISRADLAAALAAKHDLDPAAAAEAVTVYADQLGAGADLSDEDAESIDLSMQAHLAYDVGEPLDDVASATEAKRVADSDADEADRQWRAAIRAALAHGQRVVDIADAASISRERVYQIRDGRRR
jgi:hypothetical protein